MSKQVYFCDYEYNDFTNYPMTAFIAADQLFTQYSAKSIL